MLTSMTPNLFSIAQSTYPTTSSILETSVSMWAETELRCEIGTYHERVVCVKRVINIQLTENLGSVKLFLG